MYSYIGRQPLYNRDYVLYGYDLLHRDNVTKVLRDIEDEDEELRNVFSDAISMFNFEELTDNLPVHIRFTRNLCLSNFPYMVGPEKLVVEVSTDTPMDTAMADKLNELKTSGYRLALGGFNLKGSSLRFNKVLPLFDFVYINVHQNNRLQLQEMIKNVKQRSRAKLLAEQVDTEADFDKCSGLGFSYFQGLLFGMPSVFRNEVNLANTPYGKLYNELSSPSSNFEKCIQLIEDEPILTYMFLEAMPTPKERKDLNNNIRKTLMSVGTGRLRKWSSMLLLKQLNVNDTSMLPKRGYQRAIFLEKLMESNGSRMDSALGFYLGVFSLLNAVCDTPYESIFNQLRLEPEIKAALTGSARNELSDYLEFAAAMDETGAVPDNCSLKLNKEKRFIMEMYARCDGEAEAAFTVLNPFLSKSPAGRR